MGVCVGGGGGHPLNLPWLGVGLWVVMSGGGPESWGLTIGLGPVDGPLCGLFDLWGGDDHDVCDAEDCG